MIGGRSLVIHNVITLILNSKHRLSSLSYLLVMILEVVAILKTTSKGQELDYQNF